MKLTVITIAYNASSTIEHTLKSVSEQRGVTFEYILQDGGSSDDTLAIVGRYKNVVTSVKSEPDTGIADAMNRALLRATGDYVFFLHADDCFAGPHALANAQSVIEHDPGMDIYAFDVQFGKGSDSKLFRAEGLSWRLNFKARLWHQGVWAKRQLFDRIGGFDVTYHVAMDYDWAMRAYRGGASFLCRNKVLCNMGDEGVSSQRAWEYLRKRLGEERRVHFSHAPNTLWRLVYRIYWLFYKPYRFLRSPSKT